MDPVPDTSEDDRIRELPGPTPTWLWARATGGPSSPKRELFVVATDEGRDELLAYVEATREAMQEGPASLAALGEQMQDNMVFFRLDVDSVALAVDPALPETCADRAKGIVPSLVGSELEGLARVWLRDHGEPIDEVARPKPELSHRRLGDFLAWNEAFSTLRRDFYIADGRRYEAIEEYCIVPDCTCGTILVQFLVETKDGTLPVGRVKVKSTGDVSYESITIARVRFDQLWAWYVGRHPDYRDRFAARYPRMRDVGKDLLDDAAPSTTGPNAKVGRNEPCPCGSGKKFKKCCGGGS